MHEILFKFDVKCEFVQNLCIKQNQDPSSPFSYRWCFAIAFNNESHELAHIYQLNITYSFYTQWLQSLHMKWMSQVGENLKYKSKYFLWTKVKDRLVHFLVCRPQSVYKTVASKVMICLVKSSRNVTNSYIIAHLCIYTH